jgi:hypothetical protein
MRGDQTSRQGYDAPIPNTHIRVSSPHLEDTSANGLSGEKAHLDVKYTADGSSQSTIDLVYCAMTNEAKYGKKAIKKGLVLKTWCRVLKNEEKLPRDWTWETGVLVGDDDRGSMAYSHGNP